MLSIGSTVILTRPGNDIAMDYVGGGSRTAGGSNTPLQFNDSGGFAGDSALAYYRTHQTVGVRKILNGDFLVGEIEYISTVAYVGGSLKFGVDHICWEYGRIRPTW